MLSYVGASGAVDLDCESALSESLGDVRGYEWGYTLSARGMSSPSRDARKVSFNVHFSDQGELDRLRRVADADVTARKPGKLVSGEWSQRCYIVARGTRQQNADGSVDAEVTAILLDGVWRRSRVEEFVPTSVDASSDALDLPHDLPHDLATPPAPSSLTVAASLPCPVSITVFGPASSPYVVIGGNTYRVNVDVPDGGYLEIDGIEKTVKVTDSQGAVTDAFGKAERGAGEGGGRYIFERVEPGTHDVSWDKSFGFELTIHEEEGERPWT